LKTNRVVIALLAVALLASVTLNILLFRQSQRFYRRLNALHLDPLGLSHYGTEPEPDPDLTRVVLLGDSRIVDWPAPAGLDSLQFFNRGLSNQTSAEVLHRFEAHVAPLEPDIIVLQVGINDLKAIPLFPDQREAIVANCQANIKALVTRASDSGATVILTTLFPLGQVPLERRIFWSNDVAPALAEMNAHLRSLAREQVIVFDTVPLLAGEDGLVRKEFSRDLLHLEPAGYAALNKEIGRQLEGMSR
jgi:lysophospholipase L1-like esterase